MNPAETDGAFRISRNPTYLLLTILLAGIALLLNSATALMSFAIDVALTQFGVVRREERYMAAKFGDKYARYIENVRQWI